MPTTKQKILKFFWPVTQIVFVTVFFILSPTVIFAQGVDSDGDGLTDSDELSIYHTDPNLADTDGDGFNDYEEIYYGYSPRHVGPKKLITLDSDGDGVNDSWEIRLGLDLLNEDTDGDGFNDGVEINNGFDPLSSEANRVSKLVKITIDNQELAYYFGGTELERFPISGGVASMPTPEGDFIILDKVPNKHYGGAGFDFNYPNTKWNLHFTTDYWRYWIHGTYWHNDFGTPKSHGCVNVRYDQMERLYNFVQIGTVVEIS